MTARLEEPRTGARRVGRGLAASLVFLAGCSHTEEPGGGWLTARIEGPAGTTPAEATYQGSGHFNQSPDPAAGQPIHFSVWSDGTGTSEGDNVSFYRPGAARPGKGWYQLSEPEVKDGKLFGFAAMYRRSVGGRREVYNTASGELQITHSSKERVAGTFRFTGVLYCSWRSNTLEDMWGCATLNPYIVVPGAPTIEVSGEFDAVDIHSLPDIDVVNSVTGHR